jgi:hypothetical protein
MLGISHENSDITVFIVVTGTDYEINASTFKTRNISTSPASDPNGKIMILIFKIK